MASKIREKIPKDQLQKDLKRYRQLGLGLGATDVHVITSDQIVIDERVVAKCEYPKCPGYGTNANCPPYAMDIGQVRKLVDKFKHGIFVKIEMRPEDTTGKEALKKDLALPYRMKLAEIVAKIEANHSLNIDAKIAMKIIWRNSITVWL